jgi:hypothetical protein
MSDFYDRLNQREVEQRAARIMANRPDNLHDYQGCAKDAEREGVQQLAGMRSHRWTGCKRGGSPVEADSQEAELEKGQ